MNQNLYKILLNNACKEKNVDEHPMCEDMVNAHVQELWINWKKLNQMNLLNQFRLYNSDPQQTIASELNTQP